MLNTIKKNDYDDAVAALEAALRIIEEMSSQNADAGCCIWTAADGRAVTAMMTPDHCARIRSAVHVGGRCREAGKVSVKQSNHHMENTDNSWQAWMNVTSGAARERVILHVVRRNENPPGAAVQLRKFNQGLRKEVLMLKMATPPGIQAATKFLQYSEEIPASVPYTRIEIYDTVGSLVAAIEEIDAREEDIFI